MSSIKRFGSYLLLKKIATGGMAELYKARKSGEKGFEKLLAIKMILPHLASNEEFASMFIDEAKVAALLNHQNIVQIYDLGRIEDSYCIVMEYVRGKDLKNVLQRGNKAGCPLTPELACTITSSALSGLSYAHRKKDRGRDLNIVHRDVSPQNVIVSYEGEVKIVDFGIAKAATQSRDTQVGVLKGKISYMSPEQARGKPIDQRSDVFSMGIVLYEMLTGKKLFQGDTDLNTLEKVWAAKVEPLPTELNKDIPRGLEEILLKSLEKEPDARFQTAAGMEEALQDFMRAAGYSSGGYALSQYMHRLFAKDIEDELGEEEDWDQTIVSQAPTVDTQTTVKHPEPEATRPGDPDAPAKAPETKVAQKPAPHAEREAARDGKPMLGKVVAALGVVVVLGAGGMWLKSKRHAAAVSTAPVAAQNTAPVAPAPGVTKETPAPVEAPVQKAPADTPPVAAPKPQQSASAAATITSEPSGADVSVDGRRVGSTPIELNNIQPDKPHRVGITKDGYEPWSGSYTLKAGAKKSLHAALKEQSAAFYVDSTPPGAAVSVDGRDTGRTTPATLDGLSPGRAYRVRVELPGFTPYEETVSPKGTAPVRVNATLTQQYGTLTVNASPWAFVFVDAEEKGMTPIAGLKLKAGEHNLILANPKLKLKKRMKIKVEPDKTTRIMVDLNNMPTTQETVK